MLLTWRSLFQLFLDYLSNEAAHLVRCLLLHLPSDVGLGVQGEARAVVPQDVGDRFDVHALLDSQSGERMSEVC